MALATLLSALAATNVRNAVRAIRTSGADKRTQKQLLNEWFQLRDFETRARVTRHEAALALFGQELGAARGGAAGRPARDAMDAGIVSDVRSIRRRARHEAFVLLFGTETLGRLSG